MHINNLYKEQDILLFREAWLLEKCHGTSAHITLKLKVVPDSTSPTDYTNAGVDVHYFSGGTKHELFVSLFDEFKLAEAFKSMGVLDREVTVYGESYGGKEQGMSHTYGTVPKFIVFDIKIGDYWLDVPKAEKVALDFGLEFVPYHKVSTDLSVLDAWRDAPSEIAIRNGISQVVDTTDKVNNGEKFEYYPLLGIVVNPRKREGVVLRPLIELRKNNGGRIICKHKGDDFKETKTPRPVVDPTKMKVLSDAQTVAEEYVTAMRLQHVLDKLPGHCIERMREIIAAMQEDVLREGAGEIVDSKEVRAAIGKKTAVDYKKYLQSQIGQ